MYIPKIPLQYDFEGQFLISKSDPSNLKWVSKIPIKETNIYLFPKVSTISVVNSELELIGLFVGTLINSSKESVITEDLLFTKEVNKKNIEDFIYKFSGSWLFISAYDHRVKIYLDANGTIPLVFNTEKEEAASCVGLLLKGDKYLQDFNVKLFGKLNVLNEGWFPSGITAHERINRLLCNHYLCLESWKVSRHWPINEFKYNLDVNDSAKQILQEVKGTIHALLKQGKTAIALTGGNETRFLLAACRELKDELDFFTVESKMSNKDIFIANKIADLTKINHQKLNVISSNLVEKNLWLYAASHCASTNMNSYTSLKSLSNYSHFIGGLGGEVGRGFLWRKSDKRNTKLDAKGIVARLGLPQTEEVLSSTSTWLEPIKHMNSLSILDLAYLELRMSSWAFCYSHQHYLQHFHPLISRKSYSLMLNLPAQDKLNNSLLLTAIKQEWSELLQIPINKYGNYKDILELVLRLLRKPKLLVKKIRKKFG